MATVVQSLRYTPPRSHSRIAIQAYSRSSKRFFARRRFFATSSSLWAEDSIKTTNTKAKAPSVASVTEVSTNSDGFSSNQVTGERNLELEESLRVMIRKYGRVPSAPNELKRAPPFREMKVGKPRPGLLNMGVKPADNPEEDPEFEEDDINTLAHGQLEQHREYRHYARIAAWEMPLLTKLSKPFVPPTQKEVLRFRYTTYMGEEHPAEKKVVLEFCPGDMPDLTSVQLSKLKKLCGPRYNPETDIVKMSSEMFESQAQNKRYLGDLVDTLLREARDPADTFEDIPLDTRHHPIKAKPRFPVEWRMTDERKAELEALRQKAELTDQQKVSQDAIIDGVSKIGAALNARAAVTDLSAPPEPVMAMAGSRGAKGKKSKLR